MLPKILDPRGTLALPMRPSQVIISIDITTHPSHPIISAVPVSYGSGYGQALVTVPYGPSLPPHPINLPSVLCAIQHWLTVFSFFFQHAGRSRADKVSLLFKCLQQPHTLRIQSFPRSPFLMGAVMVKLLVTVPYGPSLPPHPINLPCVLYAIQHWLTVFSLSFSSMQVVQGLIR
jgi:hypothetical protein